MIRLLLRGSIVAAASASLVCALCPTSSASARQTAPQPQLYVVKDVRLEDKADAPHVSIVLRDGRIERVLDAGAQLPRGAREVDGKGMLALPAFIDAFTQAGCETPTPVAEKDAPKPEASDVQVDMREANRKGIQPAFKVADVFNLSKDKAKALRESGFGALLSAPTGQLLAGTSALATTREAAMRDTLLVPEVFAHAAFRASGPGYPSTLMGYVAQLRQFFLDVARQAELHARYEQGRPGPRPPFDADLEAALALKAKTKRVVCEADTAQDIRHWIALGDELGLDVAIAGGREAWKVADLLQARGIPLVLTLDWGEEVKDPHEKDKKKPDEKAGEKAEKPKQEAVKGEAQKPESKPEEKAPEVKPPQEQPPVERPAEPKPTEQKPAEQKPAEQKPADEKPTEQKPVEQKPVEQKPAEAKPDEKQAEEKKAAEKKTADEKKKWEYEEPLGVREEKRRLWEEGRDCAIKLQKAGVPFAFGSASSGAAELLKKVRTLVEKGLPSDAAIAALTANAAKWVGDEKHLGAIKPGADASLALWTADPTKKDAKLAWLFVDGFPNEFEIEKETANTGKPDEGVDATGTWAIEIQTEQGARTGTAELKMTPEGDLTGTYTTKRPGSDTETVVELTGHVGGKTLTAKGSYTARETEVTMSWKAELAGDEFTGTSTNKSPRGETDSSLKGTRKPKREDDGANRRTRHHDDSEDPR